MDVRSKISADGAVDLNYRKNKLDLFAYYGYSEKQREIDINSMQTLEAEENITAVQQIAIQKVHNKFHYLEGGLNYELDERHSIGAKYVYTRTPYYIRWSGYSIGCNKGSCVNRGVSNEH